MVKCNKTKKNIGYHFLECGLDYVYLLNGYEKEQDSDYGELLTIHNSDKLHQEIARNILLYKTKLEAQEIKFFRSLLRLTQGQLAHCLDINIREIQRWESLQDTQQISKAYEGLLRILVWEKYLDEKQAFTFFEKNKAQRTHYTTLSLQESNNMWNAQIAA